MPRQPLGERAEPLSVAVLDGLPAVVALREGAGPWRWLPTLGLSELGYAPPNVPPGPVDLVHPQDRVGLRRALGSGGGVLHGARLRRRGGGYRRFRLSVSEARTAPAALVLYAVDATEDGHELAPELARMVCREARPPLTAAASFAELLGDALECSSDPDLLGYVEVIRRHGHRLVRLVADLGLLAALEWQDERLHLTRVDTAALAREALRRVEAYGTRKRLSLVADVEEDLRADVDRYRMAQVLDTLVGNAVAYTPPGGRVVLHSHRRDTDWVVDVVDTGIGIPAPDQARLFHQAFRASNTRTEGVPGTGTGLLVCQAILTRHGGRIGVRSAVGQGTTVSFGVPLRAAP